MSVHLLDAMRREGFEEVVALSDPDSGLRAFLGIHDTARGPAFGGIRRWAYRNEHQALGDCLRLARAMSHKCALLDLPGGGAKVVFLDGEVSDREAAYRALGRAVERMAGRYYTGPDVGTGERELAWVASETRYATDPGPDGPGELGAATAEGVFRGMEACLEHLDGEVDWGRRRVVIQGLGDVGVRLARLLVEQGAEVRAAEIDPERASAALEQLDIELLEAGTELSQPCDVFAPCAMGGVLHDLSLERLDCRVIAGSANNVLVRSLHGERLAARDVLYAPDVVLTAGALIRGVLFHLEGRREPVPAIGERNGKKLAELLSAASEEGLPPFVYAVREAKARVAAGRRVRRERRNSGGS